MEPMPTLYTAHPDGTYREWTPPADPLDGSPRPALACCGSTGTHHSDTCRFKPAEDGDGVTAAEWIDHGIEAANDLSFIYHSNRDGPGGLKVSTVRAHLGAIIAAFEGIRAALAASPDAPRVAGLDVERLARALSDTFEVGTSFHKTAERVATEYARLSDIGDTATPATSDEP